MKRRLGMWAGLLMGLSAVAGAQEILQAGVHPDLQVSGQPDQAQLAEFAARGGVLIIDLRTIDEDRGMDEADAAARLGLHYLNLPVAGEDDITPVMAHRLHYALSTANGPVLLHCKSGNRVGALLALDAAADGVPQHDALELGKRAGLGSLAPVVREHLGCSPEAC